MLKNLIKTSIYIYILYVDIYTCGYLHCRVFWSSGNQFILEGTIQDCWDRFVPVHLFPRQACSGTIWLMWEGGRGRQESVLFILLHLEIPCDCSCACACKAVPAGFPNHSKILVLSWRVQHMWSVLFRFSVPDHIYQIYNIQYIMYIIYNISNA